MQLKPGITDKNESRESLTRPLLTQGTLSSLALSLLLLKADFLLWLEGE